MAVSCPEATNLTPAPYSTEHILSNTDADNANRTLSFSTVKLPHLTNFVLLNQTTPRIDMHILVFCKKLLIFVLS
jgi:hypothetical protein